MALTGDRGLVLKSKAKHAAIAAPLKKPFVFSNKPFVVQYEVNLQNGQECGGAYLKVRTLGTRFFFVIIITHNSLKALKCFFDLTTSLQILTANQCPKRTCGSEKFP